MLPTMKTILPFLIALLLSSCADQTIVALAPEFTIVWPQSFGYEQAAPADSVLDFGSVATGQFRIPGVHR